MLFVCCRCFFKKKISPFAANLEARYFDSCYQNTTHSTVSLAEVVSTRRKGWEKKEEEEEAEVEGKVETVINGQKKAFYHPLSDVWDRRLLAVRSSEFIFKIYLMLNLGNEKLDNRTVISYKIIWLDRERLKCFFWFFILISHLVKKLFIFFLPIWITNNRKWIKEKESKNKTEGTVACMSMRCKIDR